MSLPRLKAAALLDTDRDTARADGDYVLEEQVGHLLRRAHQRATALFLEIMDAIDLTPTQYAALVKIAEVGEISQNHLGRLTAMDPATSQGVIRRLQARGLIDLRPDPGDRRRTLLSLAAAGKRLLAPAIARGRTITARTLAPLDIDEQAALLRLLKKLT
jgi:MarR family transcriptional regulator, lower aerobic nicotinate degradation pathway regulator